jgi:hypothetical protein
MKSQFDEIEMTGVALRVNAATMKSTQRKR